MRRDKCGNKLEVEQGESVNFCPDCGNKIVGSVMKVAGIEWHVLVFHIGRRD